MAGLWSGLAVLKWNGYRSGAWRANRLERPHPFTSLAAWRARNRLSLSDAAVALGITRRMVSYYEAGRYLIPRMVGLAIKGWETERNHLSRR